MSELDQSTHVWLNLAPARWIWLPSERTLANTVVLFRRRMWCSQPVKRAWGWILADSRYRLSVNGQRVQWGPAPADPRWPEADPLELTDYLTPGWNVLGVAVLFYGHGDGTWPTGKPGLIVRLTIEYADGQQELVVSDQQWEVTIDRSHPPGQYRRWYLRALQEVVDRRRALAVWDTPEGIGERGLWVPALELDGASDRPAICTTYPDYAAEVRVTDAAKTAIRPRSVPLVAETLVALEPVDRREMVWTRDPDDWFQFRMPDCWTMGPAAPMAPEGPWMVPPQSDGRATVLTWCLSDERVGWPVVELDAPADTVVEILVAEAHDPDHCEWLDHGFYSWSRWILAGGRELLEPFDYEALRWIQLCIRDNREPVMVHRVALRQRRYPWPNGWHVRTSDPALAALWEATVNTVQNAAIETVVDGMARERQQYSGDCGHQLRVIRFGTGDHKLSARFITTFSQGQTVEGYFLDTWPAWDRLNRLAYKPLGLTGWGPILDHGLGFALDVWQYYWETGDRQTVEAVYPRLKVWGTYLQRLQHASPSGLLPVEELGVPVVWLDHDAYDTPRDKTCPFNLYTVAAWRAGLAPLARLVGDEAQAQEWEAAAKTLENRVVEHFWDPTARTWVENRPWRGPDEPERVSDLTLAFGWLFQLGPDPRHPHIVEQLAELPPGVRRSYPANSWWRYRALAEAGQMAVVLRELREQWANWPSVRWNRTLQEYWTARPDSRDEWSHCPVAPLLVLYTAMVGLRALAPGFSSLAVAPQLEGTEDMSVNLYTPHGACRWQSVKQASGGYQVSVTLPAAVTAYLEVARGQRVEGELEAEPDPAPGWRRYRLCAGQPNVFVLHGHRQVAAYWA